MLNSPFSYPLDEPTEEAGVSVLRVSEVNHWGLPTRYVRYRLPLPPTHDFRSDTEFIPRGCDPTDLLNSENRPHLPSHYAYIPPYREYDYPNETADQRAARRRREAHLHISCRREGFHNLVCYFQRLGDTDSLSFVRDWLAYNQHIPPIYLVYGTAVFDPLDDGSGLLCGVPEFP